MLNVDVLMFDVWPRKTNKLAEFVEKYLVVNDGRGGGGCQVFLIIGLKP